MISCSVESLDTRSENLRNPINKEEKIKIEIFLEGITPERFTEVFTKLSLLNNELNAIFNNEIKDNRILLLITEVNKSVSEAKERMKELECLYKIQERTMDIMKQINEIYMNSNFEECAKIIQESIKKLEDNKSNSILSDMDKDSIKALKTCLHKLFECVSFCVSIKNMLMLF